MTNRQTALSRQTRLNWLIDAALFGGALVAMLSGIYFLYFPWGGFQHGENPWYGFTLLFDRTTWDNLHTWGGVFMIAAVAVHFTIHWSWVKMMSKRIVNGLRSRSVRMSKGAKINVAVDALVAISFLLTAVSGVYFLFAPAGGYQNGRNPNWDPQFVLSRTTWDLVHTWAGVTLIASAVVHFAIHWRWVKNVTRRFFLSRWQQRVPHASTVTR